MRNSPQTVGGSKLNHYPSSSNTTLPGAKGCIEGFSFYLHYILLRGPALVFPASLVPSLWTIPRFWLFLPSSAVYRLSSLVYKTAGSFRPQPKDRARLDFAPPLITRCWFLPPLIPPLFFFRWNGFLFHTAGGGRSLLEFHPLPQR